MNFQQPSVGVGGDEYFLEHNSANLHILVFADLQESNVKLKLTIVDTVGYGDQINKEDRLKQCKLQW